MKFIIGLMAMLLPILSSAQSPPVRPLSIGDTVPDIVLTNVYNYPDSVIRLSELRGKLVILDFWSTWCGACIEAFPKMHEMQKEFGDQIQVVLVNTYEGDTIQRVRPFFEKWAARTGADIELPYSLLQAPLSEYFPYKFIPHYVWIGKRGEIVAITSQMEVTFQNVKNAVNWNNIELHVKKDLIDFSPDIPLFVNDNGGRGNDFIYRSIFTRYIEGLGAASGIRRQEDGKITRFYMWNYTPMLMLKSAYRGEMNYPSNRIIIDTKKGSLFHSVSSGLDSIYSSSYCYEIIVPPCTVENLRKYMRDDMERFFHVTIRKEVRKVKCLVIKKTARSKNIMSKGGVPIVDIDKNNLKNYLQNQPVSVLIKILNGLPATKEIPVVDETNFFQNIDLIFPADYTNLNIADLKPFLIQNGFTMYEEFREVEMLLITDK